MTVENTQNKMPPLQMGTATKYPFTFAVLLQDPTEEEALKAIKANVLQADGTEIELVYGVDYTVNLNTDRIGGTLTVSNTRTSDDYLTIYREYTHTQEVDYKDLNAAPAETFEQCFDKLTMLSQQQQEAINRSLKLNISSTTVSPTLPEPMANNTLIWDSEGSSLKNYDIIGENNAFKEQVNENFATEKENIQKQFDVFEDEVNTKIEQVSEAAEKINRLEEAVLEAENSANIAQEQVQVITNQAEQLIQDVSKEVARVEDTVEEIDKNIDKILNHVSFNFFDTKISDHILEGKEAKGWALQGTYVIKDLYPDFYNKCLEEKNSATETSVTLGSSTLTMFVNSNGHQFFNIADKSIVDSFYEVYGIADFYGIDEENKRIFLPRNKYFQQLTVDASNVNKMMEAGLPDITGVILTTQDNFVGSEGAFRIANGTTVTTGSHGSAAHTQQNIGFDASRSNSIYGNSDTVQPPSSLKLLYYCVGNTVVNDAEIDAGALVAQMEQKANIFLDNTLPTQEFKSQSASWAMPSDKYINLTVNASGSSYTAPANGWFAFRASSSGANGYCLICKNNQPEFATSSGYSYASGVGLNAIFPVKKGDMVQIHYATLSTKTLRFYYTESEV